MFCVVDVLVGLRGVGELGIDELVTGELEE